MSLLQRSNLLQELNEWLSKPLHMQQNTWNMPGIIIKRDEEVLSLSM